MNLRIGKMIEKAAVKWRPNEFAALVYMLFMLGGGLGYISGGDGEIDAGALKKISRGNPASDFIFPAGVRFEAASGTELTGTFCDSEKVTVVSGGAHGGAWKVAFADFMTAMMAFFLVMWKWGTRSARFWCWDLPPPW